MSTDLDRVDDYISNRMSEVDQNAFEVRLLEDEALQRAVRVSQALREGLRAVAREAPKPARRITAITIWAVAASVLLAVSVLLQVVSPSSPSMAGVDEIVYVEQMRSAESPEIELHAGRNALLSIDVGLDDAGPFDVTLFTSANEVRQRLPALDPTVDHYINLLLPGLEAGKYTLVLAGKKGDRELRLRVAGTPPVLPEK